MADLLEDLREMLQAMSPGAWEAVQLAHHETGEPLTRETAADYVRESLSKSPIEAFYAVLCEKEDGRFDVAHAGNGPTSWVNACGIAILRNIALALLAELEAGRASRDYGRPENVPIVPPTATMEENHRILTEWWAGGVVLLTRYDEAREAVDAAIRAAVLK